MKQCALSVLPRGLGAHGAASVLRPREVLQKARCDAKLCKGCTFISNYTTLLSHHVCNRL